MGLYEQIRDIAKAKGYSINRLELELGFARSSINKFNKNVPSADKLQRIANFLGTSMECLMEGSDHKHDAAPSAAMTADAADRDLKEELDAILEALDGGEVSRAVYDGLPLDPDAARLLQADLLTAMKRVEVIHKTKRLYNPNSSPSPQNTEPPV